MSLTVGEKIIDLGDRVAYRARALDLNEVKHFGCVIGLFLTGEILIRSDEGLLHRIWAGQADVTRKASELLSTSTFMSEK